LILTSLCEIRELWDARLKACKLRPMDHVACRQATAADISSLVELRTAFLAEVAGADPKDPALMQALWRYFSQTIPNGEFIAFLALAGGHAVAASGLVYHRHPPSATNLEGREAYVLNMYTLPAWRGRGIASALLRELVAVARKSNCRRIRLHAFPRAVSLYARAEFVPVKDEMELILR
jgi:GNAT superfamily N-acetyltransferase